MNSALEHDLSIMPHDVDLETFVDRPRHYPLALQVHVEIISATGFGDRPVYVEFESLLPEEWFIQEDCLGRKEREGMSSTLQELPAPTEQELLGENAIVGVTQMAWPRSESVHALDFDTCMTQTDLNAHKMHGSKMRGLVQGLTLFILLGVSVMNPGAPIFWVPYGAAMLVAIIWITAAGVHRDPRAYHISARRLDSPRSYFGHLLSFTLRGSEKARYRQSDSRVAPALPSPQIYFTVGVAHAFSRHTIGGYGYMDIPQSAGTYEYSLSCWKPSDHIFTRFHDFFLGGSGRLAHSTFAGRPAEGAAQAMGGTLSAAALGRHAGRRDGAFLSRLGMVTENSGELQIRVHVAEKRPVIPKAGTTGSKSRGKSTASVRSVRAILDQYKKRARLRPNQGSRVDEKAEDQGDTEAAGASEARASRRRDIRERLAERRRMREEGQRGALQPLLSLASTNSTRFRPDTSDDSQRLASRDSRGVQELITPGAVEGSMSS